MRFLVLFAVSWSCSLVCSVFLDMFSLDYFWGSSFVYVDLTPLIFPFGFLSLSPLLMCKTNEKSFKKEV